jgi:hypothetical protein
MRLHLPIINNKEFSMYVINEYNNSALAQSIVQEKREKQHAKITVVACALVTIGFFFAFFQHY